MSVCLGVQERVSPHTYVRTHMKARSDQLLEVLQQCSGYNLSEDGLVRAETLHQSRETLATALH